MFRFAFIICLSLLGFAPHTQAQSGDQIAVIVNSDVITQVDIITRAQLMAIENGNREDFRPFQRIALRALIDEELQRDAAEQREIEIDEERRDGAWQNFLAQNRGLQNLPSPLLASVKSRFERNYEWQGVVARTLEPRIDVTEREIDQLLDDLLRAGRGLQEYQVRHIVKFIDPEGLSSEEAQAALNQLGEQLAAGTEFAELASQHSDDGTAGRGGMLGWLSTAELSPTLAEVILQLETGEVSTPVEGPNGWHLLKLEATRSAPPPDATAKLALRERLTEHLQSTRLDQAARRLMRDLRRAAYINIVE